MSAFQSLLALPFARADELLSRHTTIKVGGPARVWVEPNSPDELAYFLELNAQVGAPLYVLGAGSNVVPAADGYEGVMLHLGKNFAYSRVERNRLLVAGGAAMLPKLTSFANKCNLGNFEWACGIPGSVGGSLWGNAGARGFNGEGFESRDSAADFAGCVAYDRAGKRVELHRDDVEFAYRKSSLGELIIVEATFALKPLTDEQTLEHKQAIRDLLEKRRNTQPVSAASAGCIWKNPASPDYAGAGALIEQLGLKTETVGGASISEIHGNFLINNGGTAADVRELASKIEAQVKAQTGIELEREARFL